MLNIINQCTIEGNIIKLPNYQLDRDDYLQLKKNFALIGGKWKKGKTNGFEFDYDPTELLEILKEGLKDSKDIKKEFQFFATPYELCDLLVCYARLSPNESILEPSAGQGNIIKAVNRVYPDKQVDCYEAMSLNKAFLKRLPTANLLGDDFLQSNSEKSYDNIIANPPFSKNQDVIHVRRMYDLLNKGGRIIAIMSKHWTFAKDKISTEFREWIYEIVDGAIIEEIPAGKFKESGTNVPTVIVEINKY